MAEDKDHIVRQVHRYYSCVDRGDIRGLLSLFSDDATYHRPGYAPIVGRAGLAAFYSTQRVIDEGRHTVRHVVRDHHQVAVWGDFCGTLRDGRAVQLKFADFFTGCEHGLFKRRDTFFFAPMV
ncbi:nuclear transport factor 2 family protein [Kitasatospora saccharophila]|uniref:Nuclear transport factor 2 family protein n=1 Tax=Kitasatospora saccharophila TaxID=407973 RepID=A0ABN2X8T2_9ACTN